MKLKPAKLLLSVLALAAVFGLGYFMGSSSVDTEVLPSNVLDTDALKANISAIESDNFFVGLKEYPADFPVLPYLDKFELQSISKITEDGVQSYVLHLDVDYGSPVLHVENLKKAYEADGWKAQTPKPLDGVYTFHAEKDNLVLNAALKDFGEATAKAGRAGADVTASLKVL